MIGKHRFIVQLIAVLQYKKMGFYVRFNHKKKTFWWLSSAQIPDGGNNIAFFQKRFRESQGHRRGEEQGEVAKYGVRKWDVEKEGLKEKWGMEEIMGSNGEWDIRQ